MKCSGRPAQRRSPSASIEKVAEFYFSKAKAAGGLLADDTKEQFPDYRTLAFVIDPEKLMFVLLDWKDGHTIVIVGYRTMAEANCH